MTYHTLFHLAANINNIGDTRSPQCGQCDAVLSHCYITLQVEQKGKFGLATLL